MLSLFGFGKKRRKGSRKVSKRGSRKVTKKPSKKIMKMCKKLKIKCTVKRGSKRVYKSSKVLMKAIKKKLKMLKKRKSRFGVKKSSKRFSFGSSCGAMGEKPMYFGAGRKTGISFGGANEFGKGRKRKPAKKVSKAAAMKAFKAFYRRHCSSSIRGNRFGNGGNPMLSMSMGYEFPAVLGPRSTGLFGTPNEINATPIVPMLPPNGYGPKPTPVGPRPLGPGGLPPKASAFGYRRRAYGFGRRR